jgi:crotonobetainyl-CoA:carnitine CoA-transferase CaiB-like acyl-CoA transferase
VYDPAGFAEDAHVVGRGVLVEVDDPEVGPIPMHAPFPRLSRTPGRIRTLAPALGQDELAVRDEIARIGT